jgi:hypothetical protein
MPQNFTPGTGRLALDRYDFKDHVDGTDFKHTATGIDLSTPITIDGTPYNDVQSALAALAAGGGGGGDGYSNIWTTQATTGNLTILYTDTFSRITATLSAPITITLPAASLVTVGRYYIIQDVSGNSQTHNITLTPNGSNTINGATGNKILASNSGTWAVVCNGTTSWQLIYTGFSGLTDQRLTYGSTYLEAGSLNFAGTSSLSATQLVVASTAQITSTAFLLGNIGMLAEGALIFADCANNGAIRLAAGDPDGAIYGVGYDEFLVPFDCRIISLDNSAQILLGDTNGGPILPQNMISTIHDIELSGAEITFASPPSRVVAAPIMPWGISSAVGSVAAINPISSSITGITFISDTGNRLFMSSVDNFFTAANTANANQFGCIFDLTMYMHNGATLSGADLFVTPDAHGTLPQSMPAWGIFRRNVTTGAAEALLSTNGGFMVDPSPNTAAYNVNHEITFVPDQNNIIGKELYVYYGVLFDEGGTNAVTCQFHGIHLYFDDIATLSWA